MTTTTTTLNDIPALGFLTAWNAGDVNRDLLVKTLPAQFQPNVPPAREPQEALLRAVEISFEAQPKANVICAFVGEGPSRVATALQLHAQPSNNPGVHVLFKAWLDRMQGSPTSNNLPMVPLFAYEKGIKDAESRWPTIERTATALAGSIGSAEVNALLETIVRALGGRQLSLPRVYWLPESAHQTWLDIEAAVRHARVTSANGTLVGVMLGALGASDLAFVADNITNATADLAQHVAAAVQANAASVGSREWQAADTLLKRTVSPLADLLAQRSADMQTARQALEGAMAAASIKTSGSDSNSP